MFIHTYTQKNFDVQEPEIKKWYIAAFTLPKNHYEIYDWCYHTFGPSGFNHNTRQTRWGDEIRYGEVYFSRREDLEWFLLRWS